MFEYLAKNPNRPPDYRWQRASRLAHGGRPGLSIARDGVSGAAHIRRAVRYLRYSAESKTPESQAYLADRFPDLFWAHWLYEHDQARRWELEARILAGSTDAEIATITAIEQDVIACYHETFFHVRERLDNPGYIIQCVIGPTIHGGMSSRAFEAIWKLYGYMAGPDILNMLISKFSGGIRQHITASAIDAFLNDDISLTTKLQASIAAKTLSLNQFTQLPLLELFAKLMDSETHGGGDKTQVNSQILLKLETTLNSLPFAIQTPAIDSVPAGAELRANEMLRLQAGGDMSMLSDIRDITYPEASNGKDESSN